MDFKLTEAGRYRANPDGSEYNSLTVVDEENPGTPETDTLTIDTSGFSGGEVVSGIQYTGRSEAAEDIGFAKQQRPDAQEVPYSVTLPALSASFDPAELRNAIRRAVDRRESNTVVKVEYDNTGNEITVTHTGSGTLGKLIIDGSATGSNSRASVSAVSVPKLQTKAKPKAKAAPKPKTAAKK